MAPQIEHRHPILKSIDAPTPLGSAPCASVSSDEWHVDLCKAFRSEDLRYQALPLTHRMRERSVTSEAIFSGSTLPIVSEHMRCDLPISRKIPNTSITVGKMADQLVELGHASSVARHP